MLTITLLFFQHIPEAEKKLVKYLITQKIKLIIRVKTKSKSKFL
jgi:hypothetical protein